MFSLGRSYIKRPDIIGQKSLAEQFVIIEFILSTITNPCLSSFEEVAFLHQDVHPMILRVSGDGAVQNACSLLH